MLKRMRPLEVFLIVMPSVGWSIIWMSYLGISGCFSIHSDSFGITAGVLVFTAFIIANRKNGGKEQRSSPK